MISEPIPFLANIAAIAHADGKLTVAESTQLESIQKELKLKKSDLKNAMKLVETGEFHLVPTGHFAEQVKNLELMLRVAFSDDDLDESEAEKIKSFCKKIGINQEQLNKMRREVLSDLKNQQKSCPSCQQYNETDAIFCNKCGASLDARAVSQTVKLQFDIPKTGVAIEFADSTSASFPQALDQAKASESYQSCKKGGKTWHLAVFPGGVTQALPLAQTLSGLRNRGVFVDGTRMEWKHVLSFAWCAERRQESFNPIEYCFGKEDDALNPWGCKQANMSWTGWADWFSNGTWSKSGFVGKKLVWHFDKSRILHEANTNLQQVQFCPHFNEKLVAAVINNLPDSVCPETDPDWDFNRRYEQVPGAVKIVVKENQDGFTYSDEFWADGVRPKGLAGFRRLMRAALSEIGSSQRFADSLVR